MSGSKEKKIVRRKISYQKVFSIISAGFILACILFYGGRFLKLYLENKKDVVENKNTLVQNLKNNYELNNINNEYYLKEDENRNYVLYSNILWRIIKITNNGSVKLISDDVISYLSYGETDYGKSEINTWLNNDDTNYSGILENNLNNSSGFLTNDTICQDSINDTKHITCNDINNSNLIGSLSIFDYVNAGGKDSYLNINKYFYLSTTNNEDNKVWYVNDSGNVVSANGEDIYGIRPTISLKSNIESIRGNGTIDDPYVIDEGGLFGSYVKLGNDLWRVYDIGDSSIKLMLDDYLKDDDGENIMYKYSSKGYYHNDTVNGSLAYYLNHNYLNNLSYKKLINKGMWANGIYGESNKYNYKEVLKTEVDTSVTVPSIGNIILNGKLSDYFLSTGLSKSSTLVYTVKDNGTLYSKSSTSTSKVVPVISINKDILTKGNGTSKSPYETE